MKTSIKMNAHFIKKCKSDYVINPNLFFEQNSLHKSNSRFCFGQKNRPYDISVYNLELQKINRSLNERVKQ